MAGEWNLNWRTGLMIFLVIAVIITATTLIGIYVSQWIAIGVAAGVVLIGSAFAIWYSRRNLSHDENQYTVNLDKSNYVKPLQEELPAELPAELKSELPAELPEVSLLGSQLADGTPVNNPELQLTEGSMLIANEEKSKKAVLNIHTALENYAIMCENKEKNMLSENSESSVEPELNPVEKFNKNVPVVITENVNQPKNVNQPEIQSSTVREYLKKIENLQKIESYDYKKYSEFANAALARQRFLLNGKPSISNNNDIEDLIAEYGLRNYVKNLINKIWYENQISSIDGTRKFTISSVAGRNITTREYYAIMETAENKIYEYTNENSFKTHYNYEFKNFLNHDMTIIYNIYSRLVEYIMESIDEYVVNNNYNYGYTVSLLRDSEEKTSNSYEIIALEDKFNLLGFSEDEKTEYRKYIDNLVQHAKQSFSNMEKITTEGDTLRKTLSGKKASLNKLANSKHHLQANTAIEIRAVQTKITKNNILVTERYQNVYLNLIDTMYLPLLNLYINVSYVVYSIALNDLYRLLVDMAIKLSPTLALRTSETIALDQYQMGKIKIPRKKVENYMHRLLIDRLDQSIIHRPEFIDKNDLNEQLNEPLNEQQYEQQDELSNLDGPPMVDTNANSISSISQSSSDFMANRSIFD